MDSYPHLSDSTVILAGSGITRADESLRHTHAYEEICLVDHEPAIIRWGNRHEEELAPGDAIIFIRKEQHGFINAGTRTPMFWVINFGGWQFLRHSFGAEFCEHETRRIRRSSPEQIRRFKSLCIYFFRQNIANDPLSKHLGILRLEHMLLELFSCEKRDGGISLPADIDDELVHSLWSALSLNLDKSFAQALAESGVHYDSVRHKFTRCIGKSPREVFNRMRIEHAKILLITTNLSIKEIADRVGYARQHEFARAFGAMAGTPPSAWRGNRKQ